MTRFHRMYACLLDRQGAVAIEFAAIALPLMLLLGGSIELSRYTWTRLALQDAASTGARCLGLGLSPCFAADAIDRSATVGFVRQQARAWTIEITEDSVTPDLPSDCRNINDFAKVAIRHRFTSVLAVLPETWIEVEACFPVMPSG